jgi:hypothetical protein
MHPSFPNMRYVYMSGISLSQYLLRSRSTNNNAASYVIIFVPTICSWFLSLWVTLRCCQRLDSIPSMNRMGFGMKGSWINRSKIPVFVWRDWGRPWNSIRICYVPTEIRTEHKWRALSLSQPADWAPLTYTLMSLVNKDQFRKQRHVPTRWRRRL